MIRISDKSLCCGCTACVSACPARCIVMRRDREGFDYPVANPDMCLKCGLCERICPLLNPAQKVEPVAAYAARCESRTMAASSGGIFPLLAREVIENGGVVCGAAMDSSCMVEHREAETIDELSAFSGAKYVQSELYSIYEDVKCRLDEGTSVLFSGTPCQIAGLRSYLRDEYENLYTVDIACHGVPAPEVWKRYSSEILSRHKGISCGAGPDAGSEEKIRVSFRDKSAGWKTYRIRIGDYTSPAFNDPYMKAMLKGLTVRPSCKDCIFKGKDVGADLLVGDWWGIARLAPDMDDDKGTSALVVNTPEGEWLLSGGGLSLRKMPLLDDPGNGGFNKRSFVPTGADARFAAEFKEAKSMVALLKSMTDAPLKEKIIRRLKKYLKIWR